jgi:hypothetical protein
MVISLIKRKIIFLLATLMVVLLIVVAAVIIIPSVLVLLGGSEDGPPMKTTTEYQITLDVKPWDHRQAEFIDWINAINQYSSYLDLSPENVNASVRLEYDLEVKGNDHCYDSAQVRVRDYVYGYYNGGTTVDSKGNNKDETIACSMDLGPSEEYADSCSRKCEHDRHVCPTSDKYSQETRIFFPDTQPALATCADVLALFPGIFPSLPADKQSNPVSTPSAMPWWLGSYIGTFDEDTNYEISFTLRYSSVDLAINGTTTPIYGEWSIRVTTEDGGLSTDYNPDIIADMESLYRSLIDQFGSPDEC